MDHSAYAAAFERLGARFDRCQTEGDFRDTQASLGRLYAHARQAGLYGALPELPQRNPIMGHKGWISDAECLCIVLSAIAPTLPGVLASGGRAFTGQVDLNGTLTGMAELRGNWLRRATHDYSEICYLLAGWAGEAEPAADGGHGDAADAAADTTKEELALALLASDPRQTDVQIARRVGVSRTTLYRWPRFTRAREALGAAGREHRRR